MNRNKARCTRCRQIHFKIRKEMCSSNQNPGPLIALIVNHIIILAILLFSMLQVADSESQHRDIFLNILSLIIGVYIPSPNLRRGGGLVAAAMTDAANTVESSRHESFSVQPIYRLSSPNRGTPIRAHADEDLTSADETE